MGYELKLGEGVEESIQPPVMRTRVSFSSPDYLYEFVAQAAKSVLLVSDRFVFALGIPDEEFQEENIELGTIDPLETLPRTATPIFADVQSHTKITNYLCQALPTETYDDTNALRAGLSVCNACRKVAPPLDQAIIQLDRADRTFRLDL